MGRNSYLLIVAIAAVIIASAAVLAFSSAPDQSGDEPVIPVDPPVDPPEERIYPIGISFDSATGLLSSDHDVIWKITEELVPYIEKKTVESAERSIVLDPGLYTVTADGETFSVIADGKFVRTCSWEYYLDGISYPVSVTYEIDARELSEITLEFNEYNSDQEAIHKFAELPCLVNTDDTVESIVSQLESRFEEIGGDTDDRQAYACFLASFPQLGIEYPVAMKPAGSNTLMTEYRIWGCGEYWANTLQTLFFCVGDCEDTAAVACSVFTAAGFDSAMVGVSGHVTAGVALDSFVPEDMKEVSRYNSKFTLLKESASDSVFNHADESKLKEAAEIYLENGWIQTGPDRTYYGVDTTIGQSPVGYLLNGSAACVNTTNTMWGVCGYYPVFSG